MHTKYSTETDSRSTLRPFLDSAWKTICIVGGALVVFIAARNSITWHLQRFWGASGNFWQTQWEKIYDSFDGDEYLIGYWVTWIWSVIGFWMTNSFMMFLDLTGQPEILYKYKIQPDKNTPVPRDKYIKAVALVLFNQVITLPFLLLGYWGYQWRGCSFGRELPSFHQVVFDIVIFTLLEEVFFYYSHRLLHHPRLYKYIHKIHHEWTAPVSITALYAHPVEHMISNNFPVYLGPLIARSHIATTWLWFLVAQAATAVSHCGYHFPLLPSPEFHDFHHFKFSNNFGVLGILDRLHGTDVQFRRETAYQRHFVLLSLVPVSQQIPDTPKQKRMQ